MTDNPRKHMGRECPPSPECPAHQPHPPGDGKACDPLPETTPPTLDPPAPCPGPDPCCKCPTTPGPTANCLEALIADQTGAIIAGDRANKFQEQLKKLLEPAKQASQKYSRTIYDGLVADWVKQDVAIAELLRKLDCAVWCWRCILDCYVCPLLNELHYAEKRLYDDGQLYTEVHDLYDLEYWHTRDKAAKQRRVDRIEKVMKAWANPATTIQSAITANHTLINEVGPLIGSKPGEAINKMFLRLVPMHLAIAPPDGSKWETRIDKRFTEFCECSKGTPDVCCGPDVGELSLRQRLIGPQPYLIDPNDYFKLFCCLIEKRYAPAQAALSKAEIDLKAVQDRIAGFVKQLAEWHTSFENNAKAAIPSVIDCCDYEQDDEKAQKPPRAY
jgi:hypothetical protein